MFSTTCAVLLATATALWVAGAVPWWLAAVAVAAVLATGIDCEEYEGEDDL